MPSFFLLNIEFTLSAFLPLLSFLSKCVIFLSMFSCTSLLWLSVSIFFLSNYKWVCGGRIISELFQMPLAAQPMHMAHPDITQTQAHWPLWSLTFTTRNYQCISVKICLGICCVNLSTIPQALLTLCITVCCTESFLWALTLTNKNQIYLLCV